MRSAYTVAAVRRLEHQAMVDGDDGTLMQRAAAGLAQAIVAELRTRGRGVYGARIGVLVGPGNNGGDALYAGARLARRGADVVAVSVLGTPHAAGWAALQTAGGRPMELGQLLDGPPPIWDLALDGVLGIGGRPGLPDAVRRVAERLHFGRVPVVAVDLPSGVAADTGAVPGTALAAGVPGAAFAAGRTVTFGTLKPCHLLEPARSLCGTVDLVDIGLDARIEHAELHAIEVDDVAAWWPYPGPASDKYSRGVVGIDTGSSQYPGAAVMSTLGAVHAGAGMVRFFGGEGAAEVIRATLPNVIIGEGRVQAHLVGSGWGERADGDRLLAALADEGLPVVVDADGLRYLPDRVPAHWLLTPHAGELARLLGTERSEVTADPVRAVRAGVDRTGATVLLKGATQLVAHPGSATVSVAIAGPSWTAQAGSGDVLAGICGALLAAGIPTAQAGELAASVQALAADRHPGPLPPQELAGHLPATIAELQQRCLRRSRV